MRKMEGGLGWDWVWDRRGGTVEVGWEKKSERGIEAGGFRYKVKRRVLKAYY